MTISQTVPAWWSFVQILWNFVNIFQIWCKLTTGHTECNKFGYIPAKSSSIPLLFCNILHIFKLFPTHWLQNWSTNLVMTPKSNLGIDCCPSRPSLVFWKGKTNSQSIWFSSFSWHYFYPSREIFLKKYTKSRFCKAGDFTGGLFEEKGSGNKWRGQTFARCAAGARILIKLKLIQNDHSIDKLRK